MLPNRRGQQRNPSSWDPANERYPSETWIQDLLLWHILASNSVDPAEQAAAIGLSLRGAAQQMLRFLSYEEKTQGELFNGVQADAVTYLIIRLGSRSTPLGEEQRLAATNQIMNFDRLPGESTDALLTRFMMLLHQAQVGGRLQMNWGSYAHFLIRACRVNPQQLISLLQPCNRQPPTNEHQFTQMEMALHGTHLGRHTYELSTTIAHTLATIELLDTIRYTTKRTAARSMEQH